jgi:hypothetical protein
MDTSTSSEDTGHDENPDEYDSSVNAFRGEAMESVTGGTAAVTPPSDSPAGFKEAEPGRPYNMWRGERNIVLPKLSPLTGWRQINTVIFRAYTVLYSQLATSSIKPFLAGHGFAPSVLAGRHSASRRIWVSISWYVTQTKGP